MAPWLEAQYSLNMTAEDVKALPIERKIQIMEAIWEDLRSRFDRLDVSQEQKNLLNSRRGRVKDGTAKILDWETAKSRIGRQ